MIRITLILLLLSGCATSYQPHGYTGGYSSTQISKDTHIVYFSGNGYTSANTAHIYAVKRAKELCSEQGFTGGFEIVSTNSRSDLSVMPDNIQCQTIGYNTNCRNYGGGVVSKPTSEIVVKCINS